MFTTVSFLITRLPELDDRRAWEVFEERYSPILKRYFMKWSFSEHVAVDLAQDTIQRVAEGLRQKDFHRDRGRLRDWIGGIARNVMRNQLRRTAGHTDAATLRTQFWETREDLHTPDPMSSADEHFDAVWARTRLSQLIRLAAQTFDLRTLRCYFLVEIHRLPIKEVARRTKLSETAVYQKRRKVANWLLAVGPRFISRWEL